VSEVMGASSTQGENFIHLVLPLRSWIKNWLSGSTFQSRSDTYLIFTQSLEDRMAHLAFC
jgi:hypothetical protein